MKIHHLNCGTMHMPAAPLVCNVLLAEADSRLVLIDTGFGLLDIADPRRRIGVVRHLLHPRLASEETAIRQIQALGFEAADVTDILMTHLDIDHAGGLADFPNARVHLTVAEAAGAVHTPSLRERVRFNPLQWAHRPTLVEHAPTGESWRGFAAAKSLDDVSPGIVMISLPGHTRGHVAYAVDAGDRWILHAGDAFFHHSVLQGRKSQPRSLTVFENVVAFNLRQVRANHERLAELHGRGEPDLVIINSHDPHFFASA
jgi:glyoxylase-like metal-dependent hydrolase (beta-lactamase superfamily II)